MNNRRLEEYVKRNYVAPALCIVTMEAVQMMASSEQGYGLNLYMQDVEEDAVRSSGHRGEWGEVWK